MSYLPSDKVFVFPFGGNRITDELSRSLSEQNITNIARMLTSYDSYVVNYDNTSHVIEFVLGGYYFKANVETLLSDATNLYASIVISNSVDNDYKYLAGGDYIDTTIESVTEDIVSIVSDELTKDYTLLTDNTILKFNQTLSFCHKMPSSDELKVTIRRYNPNNIYGDPDSKETIDVTSSSTSVDSGYYFFDVYPITSGQDCFVYIQFSDSEDINTEFYGVNFTTSEPIGTSYALKLLTKNNNNWEIPKSSKLKQHSDDIYCSGSYGDENIKNLSDHIYETNNRLQTIEHCLTWKSLTQ